MPAFRHRVAHFLLKKTGFFDRKYGERQYGRDFVVPIVNGRKTYISEVWLSELLEKLLPQFPGGFVDVGVNLGQTMLKVQAAEPGRKYIGFEPNPACADYANALIRKNKFDCCVVPAGLGRETGVLMLQMYRSEDTDPSASMVEAFRDKPAEQQPMVVLSWDDVPASVAPEKVAIVKIDVEGGEADVIEGLKGMMTAERPIVLVEILPVYSEDNLPRLERQKRIERVLAELDYRIFRVHKNATEKLSHLEILEEFGIHGDLALSDYLLCPAEKGSDVERLLVSGG